MNSTTLAAVLGSILFLALPIAGSEGLIRAEVKKKPSSVLVDPDWLEQHGNDPGVRIIDVAQSEKQYATGHIPGAVFVHWVKDVTDPGNRERYNVAGREMMQNLLGKLGVRKTTTIVLYDNLSNRLSTRGLGPGDPGRRLVQRRQALFWTLRYYGHEDVRIEGLHAAPPWFVLTELLGYPEVKLYDDSMAEWANTHDVPISETDR